MIPVRDWRESGRRAVIVTIEACIGRRVELIPCSPGMFVGLSNGDSIAEFEGVETGDGLLKFHFQAQGSACYSVAGASDLMVDGPMSVFCYHGRGVAKRSQIAAGPCFAVTVLCDPSALTERFGIAREEWPLALRSCQPDADSVWFAEASRLTPEMLVSVRSLQKMNFQGLMRRAYVEARATELVCDLWEQIAHAAPPPVGSVDDRILAKVEKTRLHIDRNYAEPLAMRALARNAGTNETKLSQAFRTVFGMTVFEYVRNRRMEEARRLLRRCEMSVTEIAFEVGYEHSCNFSVAYKRHFGVTPKGERAASRH